MKKAFLAALTLTTVLGTAAEARPLTKPERADLARLVRELAKDPTSIKAAEMGTYIETLGARMVCARANAKNGFGGYAGVEARLFYIGADGRVTRTVPNSGVCENETNWTPLEVK